MGSAGGAVIEVDTVQEIRRDEETNNRSPNSLFVRHFALLTKLAIVGEDLRAFVLGERSAIGARREFQQRIQMSGLGVCACPFQPSNLGINAVEVYFEGFRNR